MEFHYIEQYFIYFDMKNNNWTSFARTCNIFKITILLKAIYNSICCFAGGVKLFANYCANYSHFTAYHNIE